MSRKPFRNRGGKEATAMRFKSKLRQAQRFSKLYLNQV